MKRLIMIALVGFGVYSLWNNTDDLFDVSNIPAYSCLALALLIEFIDRE